ncbi:MAG: CRISPR-associated protein Csx3, partial [Anaerolineae bacterium]
PAVLIGGPPHSGKSVLTYSLTQALRAREVPHYVIRAYPPDGEGDWFQSGDQAFVRHVRLKGAESEAWLPLLKRDLARRHLPLIVDMGGLPTAEQETLLAACTHAVLLTRDAASRAAWTARVERHGLELLADLRSDLNGESTLTSATSVLRGTLTGLERGTTATGPVFEALVERLAALFTPAAHGLRRQHLLQAPVELTVDLQRLAAHFDVDPQAWPPGALPQVLEYLPAGCPLGLYGRGPNWLYSAVALHTLPAPFYLFDVRLGWVAAPTLQQGPANAAGLWTLKTKTLSTGVRWGLRLLDAYLDYREAVTLRLPAPPSDEGLILSGQLPLWLWGAVARACAPAPWLAVFQPQLRGAVLVQGSAPYPPGTVVPVDVT